MREMGQLSGVPIEPIEQTRLLNTCVSLAGVIGGGVPGGMLITCFHPHFIRPQADRFMQLVVTMPSGSWSATLWTHIQTNDLWNVSSVSGNVTRNCRSRRYLRLRAWRKERASKGSRTSKDC